MARRWLHENHIITSARYCSLPNWVPIRDFECCDWTLLLKGYVYFVDVEKCRWSPRARNIYIEVSKILRALGVVTRNFALCNYLI